METVVDGLVVNTNSSPSDKPHNNSEEHENDDAGDCALEGNETSTGFLGKVSFIHV
jgi:hypothetical protein